MEQLLKTLRCDLSKLIAGSFGTLVALTEITLKVLPKKDLSSTVIIYLDKTNKISDLFEILSSSSSEISGAVYIPEEFQDEKFIITKNNVLNLMILNLDTHFSHSESKVTKFQLMKK